MFIGLLSDRSMFFVNWIFVYFVITLTQNSALVLNFFSPAAYSNSSIPIALPLLPKPLPCLQLTFPARTSGHSLGTSRSANLVVLNNNNNNNNNNKVIIINASLCNMSFSFFFSSFFFFFSFPSFLIFPLPSPSPQACYRTVSCLSLIYVTAGGLAGAEKTRRCVQALGLVRTVVVWLANWANCALCAYGQWSRCLPCLFTSLN